MKQVLHEFRGTKNIKNWGNGEVRILNRTVECSGSKSISLAEADNTERYKM